MDVTLVLSAAIFTLLAIVVATSLLKGSSPATDFANAKSYFGQRAAGLEPAAAPQNGHAGGRKKEEADIWSEISGSSHDHWDVVKSVLSETEEATTVEQSNSTTSSLSVPSPGSRHMSLEVDTSSEASSGRGRRSIIGLSDTELLKCAFSYPQTEGASEGPGVNENVESDENSALKYIPGKARTHHLEMMMSKEELEEEQRTNQKRPRTGLVVTKLLNTVQREQLAAIFQLLKDNKETFGEVSEGDIEEQLRLYSI